MWKTTITLLPLLASLMLLSGCQKVSPHSRPIPEEPSFTHDIKPLLSDRCFACHGPDESKQKAGLALHTPERAYAALKDQTDAFAIVPGAAAKSAIYQRIISKNQDLVMPPPESHLSLNEDEKELIRRWIEQGAEYEGHWAFTTPVATDPPAIDDASWGKNAVDNFVLAKLREQRLEPAPVADRPTLLRRVSFDLTGLPPTQEELEDFLTDDSQDAYDKVVDRLLASPHYGERMATDWLDLSRYADSHGYQDDRPRSMWPWRDWVTKAFNDNLPYNEFVTWQLAGDLLPEPTYEQQLATGFNRNHPITQEGGVIPEEYLAEYASDRTHVFGTAFLGLTVECAKCHTHKYDPITHQDYYQLTAFFNNIKEAGKIGLYEPAPPPSIPVKDPLREQEIAAIASFIDTLEKAQSKLSETVSPTNDWQGNEHLEEGLVAYYDFDSQLADNDQVLSSLADGSPGWINFNLPPSFAPVEVKPGVRGKALGFDGKNYVSLGQTGDFEHHQAFSASLWIKHDGRRKGTAAIFGKRMDELRHNGYDLVLTKDNKLAFRLAGFWWQPHHHPEGTEGLEVRTVGALPANTWTQVGVVYDGSGKAAGVQLYVGGRAQVQRTVLDKLQRNTILNGNHLALGNYNQRGRNWGDFGGFAKGYVDEFRLYNRMLSGVEMAHLTSMAPASAPNFSQNARQQHQLLHYNRRYRDNLRRLDSLRSIDRKIPRVMVMEERDTILPTFIRLRGEYDKPGPPVTRATPSALPPLPQDAPKNRLGLARWLFSSEHPLTARVAINRLWQQCFGQGIVPSAADFGNQGDLPSHPKLLDYLAVRYREQGWDTKAMLRLIVTSATYQQQAKVNPELQELDPDNRLLARGPASKLTAEMLRDQALAASGLLYDRVGGKWVKPYQPPGLWNELASDIGEPVYRESRGRDLFRRSLYTYFKRTIPPPDMLTMDAAERTVCTVRRQSTSTPLQSLVVLNAPLYTEAARTIALKVMQEEQDTKTLISSIFKKVVSRPPNVEEVAILEEILQDNITYFAEAEEAQRELLEVGSTPLPEQVDRHQLAATTMLASAIFNLDEAQRK